MSQQGNPGEQAQQERGGARNGGIRALTLGIQSEMGTRFLKGHFQAPAQHEPFHNISGTGRQVGAKQRLSFELGQWVTHQHPANGNRLLANMKPDGSIG